ncbi:M16 family metallopeptidase [Hirschia baltica]|uniref:Peptidase M16 domain protein n=1 Tax=Hirschia baltica (strain ATCC 49814 / DSM 5838 / IFAM 1418) TaxID=582402 RepID=C6XNT9_HIRBI|nr:pitrilysin family protein [Hirschia baltica]ACT58342.1 peptidase M16 domain protein [Hirschia baltica ATCC 49814]
MAIRSTLIAALMMSVSSCAFINTTGNIPATNETPSSVVEEIASPLPGGIELVESFTPAEGEIGIPYTKYLMPNGLTIVLHEDKSDPLIHTDITYHVGSGREEAGKSGFAHFFEHMMFQGSNNVADEEHFKTISEAGGTLNGSTNSDRTNYYETIPSNQLEKILWLEADRMGFFLDAVTEEKFENQRETVKNERGQNYDNRPYGLLRERVGEALYPEGHPYSWSTIGYIEDLNRANLNDLKKFFSRWYGPNNATLTIGGDIDKTQTLEWIAKYFGSIPRGPEVKAPEYIPVTLDADRYISMEDKVALPLIYMSIPTVYARHPDEAPLDVLMSIMGEGRTSLLYKNLVKEGLAVQASAGHGCAELMCNFTLLALPNPASGKSLSDMDKILRDSIKEFETRGVEDDDLERVKAGIVSGMIYGLESVSGKVSQLAFYETFTGSPNYTSKDIERYSNVTKEDVMRVYNQYIKDKPAVVMSIVPEGQPDAIAAPDTWTMYERTIPEEDNTEELEVRYATDDFDRSIKPAAADFNPTVKLPDMWTSNLENGVDILGAINTETPTTALQIRIEAGERQQTLDNLGIASLTANMLSEATEMSTNEELSNRLAKLGSSIGISSGARFTTITVHSLTENIDETMAIVKERLLHPKFDEADFKRIKEQTLQGIEQRKTQASAIASGIFTLLTYGQDTPSAHPSLGTKETVSAITLEDAKNFYADHYTAGAASIIAVSDLSQDELTSTLGALSDWTGDNNITPPSFNYPTLEAGTLYLIDKEGAAQSEIRIGKRALKYDATGEYFKSGIMNYPLGGAFNSRININLREDKGYTYGARSRFSGSDVKGLFTASAGVRTDATADSIVQFVNEITGYYENGITEEELAFTKSAIGQSDALDYETPFDKLGFLSQIVTYDLPEGFTDEQSEILQNLTKEEVDALAKKHLNLDDMIMVVVGDKAVIEDDLKALGYPIVELDYDGLPIPAPQRPKLD